jgi:CRISPR-associated protein Csd1
MAMPNTALERFKHFVEMRYLTPFKHFVEMRYLTPFNETFEDSKTLHLSREVAINDPGYAAVCRFLEAWTPEHTLQWKEKLDDCAASGFGLFKLRTENRFIHERPAVKAWWEAKFSGPTSAAQEQAFCLITNEVKPLAELHDPKIKGVKDAQGAGALIVSFNAKAYESYGKESGFNAPVSQAAASKYCKVLNALLASSKHRIQIGDATTVFWTEVPTKVESALNAYFGGFSDDDADDDDAPAQRTQLLDSLLGTLRSIKDGGQAGAEFAEESEKVFYILGLTGQAGGRIGIRFWYRSTIGELLGNLAAHHADISIVRHWEPGPKVKNPDPEFPRIWQLLRQTGRESKDVPPLLAGALMRSILTRAPYPQLLANAVIARIRADREINYLRASLIKGWLIRNHHQSIPMTYDPTTNDAAYRLGALFALLEKTQQDALGDVNAGIRDRFYSSASATPASVFPRLFRTYGHHLKKAGSEHKGYVIYREKEVQAILAEPQPMKDFPRHLNLRDQGLFAIGYYHKRKDLWASKKSPEEEITPTN